SSTTLCLLLASPPPSSLFPYTTLFRSDRRHREGDDLVRHLDRDARGGLGHDQEARSGDRAQRHVLRDRAGLVPVGRRPRGRTRRSEEHTSELQSRRDLVCRLLLEKKKK